MKAVAFVAAMAIVSVGSIGIYNGVHNSNKLVTAESSTSASDSTDTTANTTTQDSSSKAQSTTVKGDAAKSWKMGKAGSNTYKRTSASAIGCSASSEQFPNAKLRNEWCRFLDLAPPFICMLWSYYSAANELTIVVMART